MTFPTRFVRSVISSYALAAVVAISAIVMTPVLVRGLGKDAYGIWALASAFALYFKLLEFGVGKALPQYVAHHVVTRDDRALSSALSTALALLAVLAAVALVVAAAAAAAFPSLFDVPDALRVAAQLTVLIVLLDLCFSIVSDAFGWTLIGLGRFDLINATLMVVILGQSVAWAVVLATGGGLVALALVTLGVSLAGQAVRYGLARRLLPQVTVAPRARFDRGLVAPFLRRSAWIGVIDVATIVVFRLDLVVVGLALGVRAAAVYAVAQKLTFAIEQLIQATTKAFFPHASELDARNDLAGLRASLLAGTRAALLVAIPLALTLSLLAAPLLHAWVGDGFDGAVPVVVFLSLATVVVATTRTGLLMLQATSTPRIAGLIYGGEALLNAALSIGLALTIGLKGVALGTLIAAAAGAVVFIPFLCRQFGMAVHELLVPLLRSHLPSVALTLAVGVLVTRAGVGGVLVVAAAGAMLAVYLLAFLRFGLTAGERSALAAWLRARRRGGG